MIARKTVVPAPWTDAHRREALRRTYEIAAEMAPQSREVAHALAANSTYDQETWTHHLARAGRGMLDGGRIIREVRRVRGLAEGRLVRETVERWEVLTPGGGRVTEFLDRGSAARMVAASNRTNRRLGAAGRYSLVRITRRIRRAT